MTAGPKRGVSMMNRARLLLALCSGAAPTAVLAQSQPSPASPEAATTANRDDASPRDVIVTAGKAWTRAG